MEEDRGLSDEQLGRMLQVMTTEHSALQAGRSATIFETGGRTAVFLGTVSSSLVALAFVGQISGLGTTFFAFALVLLPTLFFLGLVTFERALELGIEDYIYAVGVSRIRHFYVEAVPESERYCLHAAKVGAHLCCGSEAAVGEALRGGSSYARAGPSGSFVAFGADGHASEGTETLR